MTGFVVILGLALAAFALTIVISVAILPYTIIKIIEGEYFDFISDIIEWVWEDAMPMLWLILSIIGFVGWIITAIVLAVKSGDLRWLMLLIISATDTAAVVIDWEFNFA